MPATFRIGLLSLAVSLIGIIDAEACCRRGRGRCCPNDQATSCNLCFASPVTREICKCFGTISCDIQCPNGCFAFKYNDKCACHCAKEPVKYIIKKGTVIQEFSCTGIFLSDLSSALNAQNHDVTIVHDKQVTVDYNSPLKNMTVKEIFDELMK